MGRATSPPILRRPRKVRGDRLADSRWHCFYESVPQLLRESQPTRFSDINRTVFHEKIGSDLTSIAVLHLNRLNREAKFPRIPDRARRMFIPGAVDFFGSNEAVRHDAIQNEPRPFIRDSFDSSQQFCGVPPFFRH